MASKKNGVAQHDTRDIRGRNGSVLARVRYHLEMSQVTYGEHLAFAVKASGRLAYASVASIIHAFVPALFPATAARIVIELYKERLEEHPNPKYQEMMRSDRAPRPQNGASAPAAPSPDVLAS